MCLEIEFDGDDISGIAPAPRHLELRSIRRRGSCPTPGVFIERSTDSVTVALSGPRRASEAGVRFVLRSSDGGPGKSAA